jgi:hypothetical protein
MPLRGLRGYARGVNRRLFLVSTLALAGCGTPGASQAPGAMAELEAVYAMEAGREGVAIQVASNGCTKREDFAFYVERRARGATLAFARKRLDPCKSFAMGRTKLDFPWAELGLAPATRVFLLNPLVAWTGPGS